MKSNCFLEAVKTKAINPRGNIFYQRGSWLEVFDKRWPHFYWYNKDSGKYYHYSQLDTLSWLQQMWYEGDIMEFNYHEGGNESGS